MESRDLWHDHYLSSHLLSTAKSCTRSILHSVLATKMGQVPTESYLQLRLTGVFYMVVACEAARDSGRAHGYQISCACAVCTKA